VACGCCAGFEVCEGEVGGDFEVVSVGVCGEEEEGIGLVEDF
jgi:hypothetical protein